MSSHSISCPINKEQPTRPGSLTRDPEKLSRAMYLKCLNEILAMDKMKNVVLLDFCCSTTHLLGSARPGAGENGQTQSLLTGTEKIGMCPSFFPIFDLSSNFDSGDSLGFLDISVRRENFGQSESSLVHDSEVLEASQVASNTL